MEGFYELSFYQDGKRQRHIITDEEYLGCGMEAHVYKIKDKVVKLYKNYCQKIRLTKEQCDRLTKVRTKRILLPTKSLEDEEGNMIGYKMKYVRDLGQDSFYKLNKKDLTKEMTLIEEDIDVLSDNSINIKDLGNMNTIFHNGLYLIDAGSYGVLKETPKYRDMAYRKNHDEIDEYLIKLIEGYALEKYKDSDKVRLMIRNIKKNIYSNNLRPLEYFKDHFEYDTIDELLDTEMKKQKYSISIDGKKVSLEKEYKRIYFDDKKDIYLNKKDNNKKLILYKTRKPAVKLSQEELDNLSNIKTDRIITPVGKVEVLNNDRIAYQVRSNRNSRYNLSGKEAIEEFKLLKQDAEKLGEAGIYIGRITIEDVLYDDSIYVDSIEMMEKSANAKEENIEALNIFIKSMLTEILLDVTSPINICRILNSINSENDYFIGDALENDFNSDEEFSDCVRKMVKTRIK